MGKEIERKYLVKSTEWKKLAKGTSYRQGYLSTVKERTVRVRTIDAKGFLTIKGITIGASRAEYEYEIPAADADAMLSNLCEKPLIEKNRYKINYAGLVWEVDEFFGDNDGLIVAEVELTSEDQKIELPTWVGEQVTSDPRYFNSNLTKNPYKNWK
ncbi:MAG: CYTH domain-containing protein [Candidatus Riflebacteria bacterium]|nr:CYTH domain-containing protein [Candidatus Riflebacteria bacterium]